MKRILQVIFCASIAQLVVCPPLFPVRKKLMNKHVLPATEIACATLKGVLTKAGMLYHDQNEAQRAKICLGLASVVGCAHGATMLANAQSRMDDGNNLAAGSLIADNVVTLLMHFLGNNEGLGFGQKFSATDHGMVNALALSEIAATVLATYSPDVKVMHSIEFKTAMNNLVAAFDACEKAIISGTMHDPGIWQNLQLTVLAVAALSNFGSGFYHGLVYEKPAPRVHFRSRDSVRIISAREKPKKAKKPAAAAAAAEDEADEVDGAGEAGDDAGGGEELPIEDDVERSARVMHYGDDALAHLGEEDRCAICRGLPAAGEDRFALDCGHMDCLGCARLYYNRFPVDNPAVDGYEYRLYRCQHPGCGDMTVLDVPDAQVLADPEVE